MESKILSGIGFRNEQTKERLEEILRPKERTWIRVVGGTFFKHTVRADGKHTVEVLNNRESAAR